MSFVDVTCVRDCSGHLWCVTWSYSVVSVTCEWYGGWALEMCLESSDSFGAGDHIVGVASVPVPGWVEFISDINACCASVWYDDGRVHLVD